MSSGTRVRSVLDGIRVAVDALLPLDTNPVPEEWVHVTKVDPEEAKRFPLLYPLYLSHTDAVSVGGSSSVTGANTEATFDLLAHAAPPAIHEPSEASHVTRKTQREAALLAIPEVLNGDSEALVGTLGVGIEYLREELIPGLVADELPTWLADRVEDPLSEFLTAWFLRSAAFEAYVIQNPDSAAARRGGVDEGDVLTPAEAKQRAMAADRHLHSEILYVEYSGTYGGEEAREVLAAVAGHLTRSRVWYGGGIDSREKATEILGAGADTVVVGDIFHRVAAEEVELCSKALDELDAPADADEVADWMADGGAEPAVAARYLSTIPSVSDPERVARRYLSLTIALWSRVHDGSADDPGDAVEEIAAGLDGRDWRRYAGAFPGGEEEARSYLEAVLTADSSRGDAGGFPVDHLGLPAEYLPSA